MVSSTADRDMRRKSRVALGYERELYQSQIGWESCSLTSECCLVEAELRRETRPCWSV
jgi:hypothetical protein